MTLTTPLCRRLGIEVPVLQAPIGSAVTPELVAAVAGDVEALALYAGQSAGLVHDVAPAGRIVADIAADAAALTPGPRAVR